MLLTPWHPGQSAFPFFTDLEVAARRKMWELKSNQKKPASGKKRANHPVDFDMEMLALPLFSPSHFDGLIPHDLVSDQVEFVVEAEPLVAVAEEAIEWSDSAAAEMHYVVLLGSLKRLGKPIMQRKRRTS